MAHRVGGSTNQLTVALDSEWGRIESGGVGSNSIVSFLFSLTMASWPTRLGWLINIPAQASPAPGEYNVGRHGGSGVNRLRCRRACCVPLSVAEAPPLARIVPDVPAMLGCRVLAAAAFRMSPRSSEFSLVRASDEAGHEEAHDARGHRPCGLGCRRRLFSRRPRMHRHRPGQATPACPAPEHSVPECASPAPWRSQTAVPSTRRPRSPPRGLSMSSR